MATAIFPTFAAFKTHTSTTLPRYYTLRDDGFVYRCMGVNETSGVSHIYYMAGDEDVLASGLGMDLWFAGSANVNDFAG